MPEEKKKSPLPPRIQACGLWRRKTKDGDEFLAGRFGSCSVQIFVNEKKVPGSNQPDFQMFFAKGFPPKKIGGA